jgi:hypothetical protein
MCKEVERDRCAFGTSVGTAEKGAFWPKWTCSFSRLFCFWDGFLSDFALFDAKTTGKPHGITNEHIKHARQCIVDA